MRQLPPPDEQIVLDRIRRIVVEGRMMNHEFADWRLTLDAPFGAIEPLVAEIVYRYFLEYGLEIEISEETTANFRTIADFCNYLAYLFKCPNVEDFRVLDKQCDSAGLFLGIRKQLQEYGADPAEIAPSARLEVYLINYEGYFRSLGCVSRQKLPMINVHDKGLSIIIASMFGSLVLLILIGILVALSYSIIPAFFMPLAALVMVLAIFPLGMKLYRQAFGNRFVTASWGELNDFRDLVNALLGKPFRRRRTSVRQSQLADIPTPSSDAKTTDRAIASRLIEDRHD